MTRFTLQISDQLNQWLTEQARLNHRSKNRQIEHLLDMARRMPINNKVNVTISGQVPPLSADIEKFLKAQREAE